MTPQQHPTFRVFLSSTFRDFMQERDLLVKEIFPELRRKARQRGVDVVDVDLRWGITQEESEQGKVIPICLGEIDRCSPILSVCSGIVMAGYHLRINTAPKS